MIDLQLSDDALVNLAPQLARANGEYARRILGAQAADPAVERALRRLLMIPVVQVPTVLRDALRISVDPDQLLKAIHRQHAEAEYLERLLTLDAPVALIMATLGLRRREVRLARAAKGLSPRGTKLPEVSAPDRQRIIEQWAALTVSYRCDHPVKPWLRLAEHFEGAFSLRALHVVITRAEVKP